jgi:hypothetical protein
VSGVDLPAPTGAAAFGNVILSRLKVRRVFASLAALALQPTYRPCRAPLSSRRGSPFGPLRIITAPQYSRARIARADRRLREFAKEGEQGRGRRVPRLPHRRARSCAATSTYRTIRFTPRHRFLVDAWQALHPDEAASAYLPSMSLRRRIAPIAATTFRQGPGAAITLDPRR